METTPILVQESIYLKEFPTLDAWIERNKIVIQHLIGTTGGAWMLTIGNPSDKSNRWRRVIISANGIRDNVTGQLLRTTDELQKIGINVSARAA